MPGGTGTRKPDLPAYMRQELGTGRLVVPGPVGLLGGATVGSTGCPVGSAAPAVLPAADVAGAPAAGTVVLGAGAAWLPSGSSSSRNTMRRTDITSTTRASAMAAATSGPRPRIQSGFGRGGGGGYDLDRAGGHHGAGDDRRQRLDLGRVEVGGHFRRCFDFGARRLGFGSRRDVGRCRGARRVGFGARCLGFGARCLGFGARCLGLGARCLGLGARCLGRSAASVPRLLRGVSGATLGASAAADGASGAVLGAPERRGSRVRGSVRRRAVRRLRCRARR